MPHRIRLTARWKLLREGVTTVIDLPFETSEGGEVTLSRSFGKPGNLAADDRVRLMVEGCRGSFVMWLNEVEIGRWSESNIAIELTELSERNEVRIVGVAKNEDGFAIRGVFVDIESG